MVREYCEDFGQKVERKGITFHIKVLKGLITKDNKLIEVAFTDRLKNHQFFFSSNRRNADVEGLFDLEGCGIAALCNDLGLPVTIESEYLPRFLIEGTFTKERLTWPMV